MDVPAYEDFLKHLKFNLWLSGIPYGSSKSYPRYYFLTITLAIVIGQELVYVALSISSAPRFNILELMKLAPCLANGILALLKGIVVMQKRVYIYELTENLRQLYDSILIDNKKRQIVRYDLVLLKILLKYFFILNLVLISVYNLTTLVIMLYHYLITNEIEFMLPFIIWVPFSINSWISWFCVYIYSCICGFIAVLFYTTIDALYFVLTSHVCANFCIISDTIESLDETKVDHLGDIVKAHQNVLKLGEDLENIFKMPNLMNILLGSFQICALGFNLTMGPWNEFPSYILFLISIILQILMMSVFGENIIRSSTKIGDAAFLCDWYKMDLKSKKIILTIMIRSQKPLQLTGYKFSIICYASFTKIMSTSWSYFTILKTVYKPSELK